jgi:hypothetical protein
MDNTTQAYVAIKKFEKAYDDAYYVNATETQRNSKHFDIGRDGGYQTPERDALLQTFGFKNEDDFCAAVELTDWKIAYNKFHTLQSLLTFKSNEYNALWTGIKAAGFYDEEDHNMDGIAMWNIAKKAAPKHVQLIELTAELGLKIPSQWKN